MTLLEHLNPFHSRRVVLETTLAPGECTDRIRADLAPFWTFWGTKQQMKGKAGEGSFSVHRYAGTRRSLPSGARGTLVVGGRGTRIECSIGWRRSDLILLACVIPVVALFMWGMTMAPSTESPAWVPIVFPALIVFALAMNRAVTLHDDDWLVTRLCELLDATEVPGSTF